MRALPVIENFEVSRNFSGTTSIRAPLRPLLKKYENPVPSGSTIQIKRRLNLNSIFSRLAGSSSNLSFSNGIVTVTDEISSGLNQIIYIRETSTDGSYANYSLIISVEGIPPPPPPGDDRLNFSDRDDSKYIALLFSVF